MSDLTSSGEPSEPAQPTPPPDVAVDSGASAGPRAPRGWQNWHAHGAGRPANRALEYAWYSDASLTGLELKAGPTGCTTPLPPPPPGSQAIRALVLRADLHLDDSDAAPTPPAFTLPERPDADQVADRFFKQWTDTQTYHGGQLPDELAVLVCLALGIRLRNGGVVREFRPEDPDPRGRPVEYDHQPPYLPPPDEPHRRSLPATIGDARLDSAGPYLARYPALPAERAVALVRAARTYQEGLWVAESDPRQAWLRFVSAVEPAASYWAAYEALGADVPEERLRTTQPELADLLVSKGEEHLRQVAAILARIYGSTGKFTRFLLTFAPGPPKVRPPHPYQQVDWTKLSKHLDLVYRYRSKDLHAGIPIPQPMCEPPHHDQGMPPMDVPLGLWTSIGPEHASWARPHLPMLLHVFEGIVRRALLAWWMHQPAVTEQDPSGRTQQVRALAAIRPSAARWLVK